MIIDQMLPADAEDLVKIAFEWGEEHWTCTPGAAGVVARDVDGIQGFALIREMKYGFVIDELWCHKTRAGHKALLALANWIEERVLAIAHERGCPISLGGIVRLDNPLHDNALAKRGFEIVANVRAKTLVPSG